MKSIFVLWLAIFHIAVLTISHFSFAGTWRDDFEDRDIKEWSIYNLNRQVEKWWINDGEAVGEIFQPGFMSLWLTGDLKWQNYSISCRVKLVEEKNDPSSVALSLHDRGEEDSRYLFFINYTLGTVSLVKATPNEWFIRNFPFVADIDTWYELRGSVDGEQLEFQVDDQVFVGQDAEPLRGGQAGLVVSNAQARFDDVQITGNGIPNGGPGKARPVDQKGKLATTWARIKKK